MNEPEDVKEKNKEETLFDFFHTPRNKGIEVRNNNDRIKRYSSIEENHIEDDLPLKKRRIKKLIPITESHELTKNQLELK